PRGSIDVVSAAHRIEHSSRGREGYGRGYRGKRGRPPRSDRRGVGWHFADCSPIHGEPVRNDFIRRIPLAERSGGWFTSPARRGLVDFSGYEKRRRVR